MRIGLSLVALLLSSVTFAGDYTLTVNNSSHTFAVKAAVSFANINSPSCGSEGPPQIIGAQGSGSFPIAGQNTEKSICLAVEAQADPGKKENPRQPTTKSILMVGRHSNPGACTIIVEPHADGPTKLISNQCGL